MIYRKQSEPDPMKAARCPECGSSRLLYQSGTLKCHNCGHTIGKTFNKYGAKRTEFNGKIYDSKFEANVAQDLYTRKLAGDIKDFETQYKIECWAYRADGTPAFKVSHKVDFRLHLQDGSYELLEAKGLILPDYKWRRQFLEKIWLPEHPDHIYTVIQQNGRNK